MSEDAMKFLGLLHEEIVCFYCRNQYNPFWNLGPSQESESCHVCGSRLGERETLKDHEQANGESRSNQVTEPDQSSLLKNAAKSGSNSASKTASSANYIKKQNMHEIVQPPLGVRNKRKRPAVERLVSPPPERIPEQICNDLQGLAISLSQSKDGEDVLIYQLANHYIPENEIGLGCMVLLQSAVSPPIDSRTEFPAVSTINARSSKKSKPKPSTGGRRVDSSPASHRVKASPGLRSPVFPSKVSKDSLVPRSRASLSKDTKLDSGEVLRFHKRSNTGENAHLKKTTIH